METLTLFDSFSSIHSYAYSIIALQEVNIYYHFNSVYWNVGCLLSECSSNEEGSGGSVNYGKIAKAIYKMKAYGITISPPNINQSDKDFSVNADNNEIFFSLIGISGINADIAEQIIRLRPYHSFKDFYNKHNFKGSLVTASKIRQLIKGGCFDEFTKDKIKVMKQYILYSTPKPTNLTSANISAIVASGAKIPKSIIAPHNFYKYVCSKQFLYGNHPKFKSKKLYRLDDMALRYFNKNCKELLTENVDFWEENGYTIVVDKSIEKVLKPALDGLKAYINTPEFIDEYYKVLLKNKYIEFIGESENPNHWCFQALSYYTDQHELYKLNFEQYNISHFQDLPTEPQFVTRTRGQRTWKQYEISRIVGVLIDKNDSGHFFSILTPDNEVVECNIPQESYAFYKSRINDTINGINCVVDDSWIKRGNLLIVTGYRRQEGFVCKTYKKSIYQHKIQLITEVQENGEISVQSTRYKSEEET